MTVERKFIDLKSLKVSDEGPGTIEGYRSVFSEIDEGGDLIVKGFFADAIPEYLDAGFSAHSHDWDFDKAVGFPVRAEEDDHGFFVVSQFHSTDDAQNIRKKAQERMDAGKRVGFSFGYSVSDKQVIEAKDYEKELVNYVKPARLQANLAKAKKFDRIRILKKGEVIEDSIVTSPMNKLAMATAVKSEVKEPAETETPSLKDETVADSFESFDKAVSAIEKNVANMQRNHENRVKEGRVLSTSNRSTVQACRDSLEALMGQLDELLMMTEPKPKEKGMDALRTQAERIRHSLLASQMQ